MLAPAVFQFPARAASVKLLYPSQPPTILVVGLDPKPCQLTTRLNGDVVEVQIDGIGTLRNPVQAA